MQRPVLGRRQGEGARNGSPAKRQRPKSANSVRAGAHAPTFTEPHPR
jgi:hypothetical protein